MAFFESLLGAASSVFGGLLGKSASDQANSTAAANAAAQQQLQMKFAKNGIQWRVQDAQKAGIHPLYALGASIPTYTPNTFVPGVDNSLGSGIAAAGQNVGRALDATSPASVRQRQYAEAMMALELERGSLQNELLRSNIAKLNQNPPMPTAGDRYLLDGQSGSGVVSSPTFDQRFSGALIARQPMQQTATQPGAGWQEPGAIADVGYARTERGLAPVPTADVKQRIEDMLVPQFMWALRNNLLPNLGIGSGPKGVPVPKGKDGWVWNPFFQEYQPMRFPKWMGRYGKYFAY